MVAVLQECAQKGDSKYERQVEKVDGNIRRGQGNGLPVKADGDGDRGRFGEEVDRQRQEGNHQEKGAEDMDREDRLVLRTGKCGDEGLGKSPLGKDTAKEVGQFEGDEKDITVDIGAQNGSGQEVSDKPQNTRKKDAETVGEYVFKHLGLHCGERWREIEKKVMV